MKSSLDSFLQLYMFWHKKRKKKFHCQKSVLSSGVLILLNEFDYLDLEQYLCNPVCKNHISEVVWEELIVKLAQNTNGIFSEHVYTCIFLIWCAIFF